MPVYGGAPQLAGRILRTLMWAQAPVALYRRHFVPSASPSAYIGGPMDTPQPIGTRDQDAFDPTENAILDTTVDAGTGYVGGYDAAVSVHVLIGRAATETALTAYGMQLNEPETTALLLAVEIVPTRGDLIVMPDTTRYVVSEQITPIRVWDVIVAYSAQVERRDPTDPVYTA